MLWLFYALLSAFVFAVVTFIDKYLLVKEIKDYRALPIYAAIIGFIFGVFIWLLTGRNILNWRDTLLVTAVGNLTFFSLILYFKTLEFEETSKINILFQLLPIQTLILAYIFLKETLTLRQFFGFILVLFASILVLIERNKQSIQFSSRTFIYMFIYNLFWAIAGVLMKFIINQPNFWTLLVFESWGIALGGLITLLLIKTFRQAFLKSLFALTKRAIGAIAINESTFILAKSLSYYAFLLGSVTLVSVLTNTQVFWAIFLGWLLTSFWPKIFKEKISKKHIISKLVSAIILFIGLLMFL